MQIDVEVLFSSDPFGGLGPSGGGAAGEAASRFAFVKSRATGEVELRASSETTTVTLSHVLPQLGCAIPTIVARADRPLLSCLAPGRFWLYVLRGQTRHAVRPSDRCSSTTRTV